MQALRHSPDHTLRLDILPPSDNGWPDAAGMIRAHFHHVYQATITVPAVDLAVARSPSGVILGAAGIRGAESGFFSQAYLDRPVADILSQTAAEPVRNDDILEVVSMACPRAIATLPLIEEIAAEARRRAKSWCLFTATTPLAALLRRTGVPLLTLAPARRECLPDAAAWGRYYDTDPWVCALQERGDPLRFMPRSSRISHKVPPHAPHL
ncbi:thermostable hemolysin [Falsirhodobacter halotolerans]|uniref:thermostable hemolysin n=1 Tax=Falsirhodobacter halotolerans TaxID=1146892 RepID=UPI001FD38C0A|nr:thermostable hemolysin [Falsirhodobacter halotolerans]MCJ8140068.1 thermostable hemolysin [Falsirhodobacter halotolerans]